jgi:hypothetical protein
MQLTYDLQKGMQRLMTTSWFKSYITFAKSSQMHILSAPSLSLCFKPKDGTSAKKSSETETGTSLANSETKTNNSQVKVLLF